MNEPGLSGGKLANFLPKRSKAAMEHVTEVDHSFYSAHHFHHMLRIERKRTERSKKPFLLMLIDISKLHSRHRNGYLCEKIKSTLFSCSRETDIRGWYEHNKVMGTIFTEMGSVDNSSIEKIFRKIHTRIGNTLGMELLKKIGISLHVFRFPEKDNKKLMASGL